MRIIFAFFMLCYINASFADDSALDNRLTEERNNQASTFSIIPHKPTYVLPVVFNDKIQDSMAYQGNTEKKTVQQVEMKFQISFKMPIAVDIADLPLSAYFAYSQVSYWQAYNSANSSPFRETNYEPEAFLIWQKDTHLGLGWTFKAASFGFAHQSNGRAEPLSRSWNRLEARFIAENGNLIIALNPWYRFQETPESDNNPDLLDYYGHGKLTMAYKFNAHTLSLTTRNNLESSFSKGSTELAWSFPIHGKIRGYMQFFSGYGNSLIEYNHYTNTIGIGISLTDWL